MSYRIYVSNGKQKMQLFGNNEYPEPFIEELKKQGCKFGPEGTFDKFKIKTLAPIMKAIDQYIINTVENYNQRVKKENEWCLAKLNRPPKDSDYEGRGYFDKLLTTLTPDCYPSCNFTVNYKNGVEGHDITSAMMEIIEYGYIFIGVNLLNFIGCENYRFEYDKELDCRVFELKEGVTIYFEGY